MATIGVDVLTPLEGHDDRTLVIDDGDPEKRKGLAKEVEKLIRKGFAVLLGGEGCSPARKVKGYDPDRNEWIVTSDSGKGTDRVPADCSGKATAVAPVAGG